MKRDKKIKTKAKRTTKAKKLDINNLLSKTFGNGTAKEIEEINLSNENTNVYTKCSLRQSEEIFAMSQKSNTKLLQKKREKDKSCDLHNKTNTPKVALTTLTWNKSNSVSKANKEKSKKSNSPVKETPHFTYKIGQKIKGFTITRFLGDGTFGRVFEVENKFKDTFAMKVIKPVPRYADNARAEAEMIKFIESKDIENIAHVVHLKEVISFTRSKVSYVALVFERLGRSLYQLLEENNFMGIYYII
jgi:dual-specificity kinase